MVLGRAASNKTPKRPVILRQHAQSMSATGTAALKFVRGKHGRGPMGTRTASKKSAVISDALLRGEVRRVNVALRGRC